jgi:hypothetical protein
VKLAMFVMSYSEVGVMEVPSTHIYLPQAAKRAILLTGCGPCLQGDYTFCTNIGAHGK